LICHVGCLEGILFIRKQVRILATIAVGTLSALAQRTSVVDQIKAPHPYYYREMYLPQLTTGPSAAAWMPDSKTLVYSMAGSLWKQSIGSTTAEELAHGPGYDYQPDCSRDGRWVVYASSHGDAVELRALDLTTGESRQLTHGGINLEPRFSPDGKRIVFVSTAFNGRFHLFLGDFANGELTNVRRLTGENRSPLPRYYYSPFDHEINPTWSPDGSEVLFVSNRGHIYGTGGFWRMKAEPGAEPREIHYEETAWRARPDFSPDGKRIVYGSYLGQQWHHLWLMPSEGGDAFAVSYGDFDNLNPRWSPDGKRIAFISNRGGNTSLWVQQAVGGAQEQVVIKDRRYLKPTGRLAITVLDPAGRPTAARITVTGSDERNYAPDDAWMQGDDLADGKGETVESHHFMSTGRSMLTVPAGSVNVEVSKGFEYRFEQRSVAIKSDQTVTLTVRLRSLPVPRIAGTQWVSGDVHVHMNYAGTYRATPKSLAAQAAAENLAIVENLVVNKEQRIPDIAYFQTTGSGRASGGQPSTATSFVVPGQEFHTSYWGHLGLLNLTRNFILPDYAAYAHTAAASLYPHNAAVADMAHQQGGLVGYVHPFDDIPDPAKDESLTNELPVDVALGKVDYMEVLGFSDHKHTAEVWYRLLNCGFRVPAAAGTDAMTNYASPRGPVGLDRVYAQVPAGRIEVKPWLKSLKEGRTFATNGPLIGFVLGGKQVGDTVKLGAGQHEVKFSAWLRSIVPVDHLEIICNGKMARDLKLTGNRDSADIQGTLPISQSGWCLLRTWSDEAAHALPVPYPYAGYAYATTSPVYVSVEGSPLQGREEATYFMAWIDRLVKAAEANQDWNAAEEKEAVLKSFREAREVYERVAGSQ
jgi:Tol biopolymer transport system component